MSYLHLEKLSMKWKLLSWLHPRREVTDACVEGILKRGSEQKRIKLDVCALFVNVNGNEVGNMESTLQCT